MTFATNTSGHPIEALLNRMNPNRNETETSPIRFGSRPGKSGVAAKLRLMTLVTALMLVLVAMNEARKPENWAWLGLDQPKASETSEDNDAAADRQFESAGIDRPVIVRPLSNGKNPATAQDDTADKTDDEGWSGRDEPIGFDIKRVKEDLNTVRVDFWKKCFNELSLNDRKTLFQLVRLGRMRTAIDTESWRRFDRVWDRVDSYRRRYHTLILSKGGTPEAGGDADRELWYELLYRLKQQWSDEVQPAVQALRASSVDDVHAQSFERLQVVLDEIAAGLVEDGTAVARAAESPIWIRWIEEVQASWKDKDRPSPDSVSHLKLMTQPSRYRGKDLHFEGRVRAAQKIPAGQSDLNIDHYYSLWIQDVEGGTIPFSVFALELPDGFPEVGWAFTKMDVPVSIDAKFFKIRVYDADNQTKTCPFLIAHTPVLNPQLQMATTSGSPKLSTIIFAVLLLVVIAFLIASRVYRSSQSPRLRIERSREKIHVSLGELQKDSSIMTPGERLRTFDPDGE